MRKLTLSLILIVVIAIVGLGWGLDYLYNRYTTPSSHSDTVSIYKDIGQELAQTLNQLDQPDNFIQLWQQYNPSTSVSISDADSLPLPTELASKFQQGEPVILESEQEVSLYFFLANKNRVLALTTEQTSSKKVITLNLVFTLFFYCGIIILISLWLYPLIKRLQNLRTKAKAFGEGDLDERIDTDSISYISDIEKEFNRMAQRIQTLVNDNKLLGNAVSHDLRTPLARLRFGIDTLAETQDAAIQEKYVQRISSDIDEMESLVEVLLNYARLDQAMIEIKKQSINITELLHDCVNMFSSTTKTITQQIPLTTLFISGDSRYLGILINNLLQNASQYSSSQIIVTLLDNAETCEIVFADDGPGIPMTKRDDIIKPFIRGDTEHKGYGMGLAIVSRITEWHNGDMHIGESTTLGGAQISITLPKGL